MSISRALCKISILNAELQRVLATHESSSSRVLTLEDSYRKLGHLSISQDELFREALRATEAGLFRASHVLAWSGFIDFLHQHLGLDELAALRTARPKWSIQRVDDLREYSDHQVIEAGKDAGHFDKTMMKALHGLLNKRNECAHPSAYFPDLNQTLGYISELIQRIETLQRMQKST